ncbi:thiamine phosphate synthase [Azospirillum halopraeferens]|uniref:thiamine phosphate synthase n=1 Tax=Azospirillum halopraeferens TaxID=34010 RepID=UPI0004292FF1|nr:thiamine phosphate synthase [Azospirillum halopraeferens]
MIPRPSLLVITDRHRAGRPLPELADALFAAGVRWLSLRDKDLEEGERLALARTLVARGRRHGAVVTLHGAPETALAAGAAGVHLADGGDPRHARAILGPRALVGVSAHDAAGLAAAAAGGADYATLSPVFPTASKPGYGPALGPEGLRAAVAGLRLPVLALGGIGPAQAAAAMAAGAAGVAVMGLAMAGPDPAAAVAALLAVSGPGRPGPGQKV